MAKTQSRRSSVKGEYRRDKNVGDNLSNSHRSLYIFLWISLSHSLWYFSLSLSLLFITISLSYYHPLSYNHSLTLSIFLTGLTPTKEHLLTLYGWVSLYGWPSAWQIWIQLLYLCWMIDMFGQIQTSQTEGQPYSNTYPFKVSECCLLSQTRVSLSLFSSSPFLSFCLSPFSHSHFCRKSCHSCSSSFRP